MATVLTWLLGVPIVAVVGYRLVIPSKQALDRRAAALAANHALESERPPRHRARAETDEEFAARCNVTLGADNGVRVDAGEVA